MNLTELRNEFERAREYVSVLKSRNVDTGTLDAAIQRALALKARLEQAQGTENQRAAIDRIVGTMRTGGPSLGHSVMNSGVGDFIKQHAGHLPDGPWSTGSFELMATTMDESGGSGGPLVITDVQPGILPLPTRNRVVADLMMPGTTTSNSITYLAETTFTNAAAPVAEGAAKPESTLVFTATVEPVRKIAHFIPITDELLTDVSAMTSYLDGRMRLGVQLAEDDGLLNGSGTPPALTGLMNRSGLATAQARGTDNNADAIAKQISAIATNALMQPDGIIIHPTNWQTILLAKDANGQYYGDGPFRPLQTPTLWGLPVAITPAIAVGTALVGAFKQATQIFRNGNLRVEMSNSHNDFFTKNLVAVRSEERLALALYRSSAVGKVTGLN